MEALFGNVVDFVSANARWAPWVVFAVAFGETLAFLSLVVPGTVILVAIGGLAATGSLDMTTIWIAASLGALAGATLSWWVGRRFGPPLLGLWPFSRDPGLQARSARAFARWGTAAVFVGHFFGPLRSVIFVVAGISMMPASRFQLANVPASLIWAYAIPKTGEIGGDLAGHLWRWLAG